MSKDSFSKKPLFYIIAGAALFIALLAVYSPLFTGSTEFNGDDYMYILDNPAVTEPSVGKTLLSPTKFEYFPVTIASYAAEYPLWGADPKGYRLVNLTLFVLICLGALSMTNNLVNSNEDGWRSCALAFAAVFILALHPANVESVASVSNRKELLYVLFGIISLRLYMAGGGLKTYVPALVLLILAQLSKGTGVILPLVLTAYEMLRARRGYGASIKRLLPLYAISGAIFLYQMSVARATGVVGGWEGASTGERLGAIAMTLSKAVSDFFVPINLSFDYDLRRASVMAGDDWILPVLLALAFVYLIILYVFKKNREALFLFLLITIPFVPYSNVVPLKHILPSNIVYYDHYLLFSVMAAAPLAVYIAKSLKTNLKHLAVAAAAVAAFFAFQDYRLSGLWKTREGLYLYTIEKAPAIARSYYFLGHAYIEQERYGEALSLFERADALGQKPPENYYQWLGNAYAFSEKYDKAVVAYTRHLAAKPDSREVLQNLSSALLMLGRYDDAEKTIASLLSHYPNDPDALANLRVIREQRGRK